MADPDDDLFGFEASDLEWVSLEDEPSAYTPFSGF